MEAQYKLRLLIFTIEVLRNDVIALKTSPVIASQNTKKSPDQKTCDMSEKSKIAPGGGYLFSEKRGDPDILFTN